MVDGDECGTFEVRSFLKLSSSLVERGCGVAFDSTELGDRQFRMLKAIKSLLPIAGQLRGR
jgi:hypothetical protein